MTDSLRRLYRRIGLAIAFVLAASATPAVAKPCVSDCLTPGDYTITTLTTPPLLAPPISNLVLSLSNPVVSSPLTGLLPRTYLVHVPASYTGQRDVPLLLDYHGGTKDAWNQRTASGQLAESDRRGFIVVWPNGIGGTLNGYGCCVQSNMLDIDDVGFSRQIIAAMKTRAAIDDTRVFVTGISNGGAMAHRMACDAADVVRAAAPVSYSLNTDQCRPARPIHVTAIMGTDDDQYEGVPTGRIEMLKVLLGIPSAPSPSARESFAAWKRINNCSDALTRTQLPAGTRFDGSRWEEYRTCSGGVRTGLVTIVNGPHILYNGYKDPIFDNNPDAAPIDLAPWIWDNIFNI